MGGWEEVVVVEHARAKCEVISTYGYYGCTRIWWITLRLRACVRAFEVGTYTPILWRKTYTWQALGAKLQNNHRCLWFLWAFFTPFVSCSSSNSVRFQCGPKWLLNNGWLVAEVGVERVIRFLCYTKVPAMVSEQKLPSQQIFKLFWKFSPLYACTR